MAYFATWIYETCDLDLWPQNCSWVYRVYTGINSRVSFLSYKQALEDVCIPQWRSPLYRQSPIINYQHVIRVCVLQN